MLVWGYFVFLNLILKPFPSCKLGVFIFFYLTDEEIQNTQLLLIFPLQHAHTLGVWMSFFSLVPGILFYLDRYCHYYVFIKWKNTSPINDICIINFFIYVLYSRNWIYYWVIPKILYFAYLLNNYMYSPPPPPHTFFFPFLLVRVLNRKSERKKITNIMCK